MRINEVTKNRPIVYVDMDGVLADLFNHVAAIHDVEHYNHMRKEEWETFFRDTDAHDLFANIPPFANANQLLSMVKKMAGGFKILSSPLNYDREGSIKGKLEWLADNIHVRPNDIIFEHEKQKYAVQPDGTPNILIDDYGVNIRNWRAAGGIGIKYQADENTLAQLQQDLSTALGS